MIQVFNVDIIKGHELYERQKKQVSFICIFHRFDGPGGSPDTEYIATPGVMMMVTQRIPTIIIIIQFSFVIYFRPANDNLFLRPCLTRLFLCLKVLLQSLHLKVFSSLWDILCLFRSLAEAEL